MLTRRAFLHRSIATAAAALPTARRNRFAAQARADRPVRAFAAGPPAAVLVYALAPESLVGWPSRLEDDALDLLGPRARALPVVGRLAGRASTVSTEALLQHAPDLIVDVGTIDATYTSLAARVREQTGLRYELLDGRFDDSAALIRRAGDLLGVPERASALARTADRIIAGIVERRAARAATRVYFARGADGLETGLAGSINVEVLEFVGATNAAAAAGRGGLTRVSLEQVLRWDPDVILTQDAAFARHAAADPTWRVARAVRERRVWLAPHLPFGWLDAPPGINRLVGAQWLAGRLDGAPTDAIRSDVARFHDEFYGVRLDAGLLDRLLGEGR